MGAARAELAYLLNFIGHMRRPPRQVRLVHGDDGVKQPLATLLRQRHPDMAAVVPQAITWPDQVSSGYDGQMQINILDAKNRLSQLVKLSQSGQEIVIAKRGQPVARLVAVHETAPLGLPAGDVNAWLARCPLPAHARRSAAEIDAALLREQAAWD